MQTIYIRNDSSTTGHLPFPAFSGMQARSGEIQPQNCFQNVTLSHSDTSDTGLLIWTLGYSCNNCESVTYIILRPHLDNWTCVIQAATSLLGTDRLCVRSLVTRQKLKNSMFLTHMGPPTHTGTPNYSNGHIWNTESVISCQATSDLLTDPMSTPLLITGTHFWKWVPLCFHTCPLSSKLHSQVAFGWPFLLLWWRAQFLWNQLGTFNSLLCYVFTYCMNCYWIMDSFESLLKSWFYSTCDHSSLLTYCWQGWGWGQGVQFYWGKCFCAIWMSAQL